MYMSLYAAAGAASRNSIASRVPFARRITMNAPPPMPLECGCVTPRHSAVATAASTACPPSSRTCAPIALHRGSSAATAPSVVDTCSSAVDRGACWGELGAVSLGEDATAMIVTRRMRLRTTEAATTCTARDPSARRSPRHSLIRRRMPPSRAAISARTRPPARDSTGEARQSSRRVVSGRGKGARSRVLTVAEHPVDLPEVDIGHL